MKKLILIRNKQDATGTGGIMLGHDFTCATLELPWRNNEAWVSCIPEGDYICSPDTVGKHKYFRVENVPGREGIEFHVGNATHDSNGCILVGNTLNTNCKPWRLFGSTEAILRMVEFVGNKQFQLKIINL